MQSQAWVAVLRHIPAEQHNQYSLVTNAGAEITIQSLLRLEQDFVIIKGRLAGSQEAGRIFFVPYAHIDYLGTLQPVKDVDFSAVFDSLVVPTATPSPAEPPAQDPPRPDSGARPAIRSEVLDRFRSRPASSPNLPRPKVNGNGTTNGN